MKKKMFFLALTLTALATLSIRRAEAGGGTVSCPQCVTYADGSRCCVSCICDATTGALVACTNHFCPPA